MALKSNLLLPDNTPLPAASVKHSDEQTIAALAAVLTAIHKYDLTGVDFTNWGVLAAPRFLGRQALAHTLQRYAAEGAWGISPHVIPHRLLHAVSGTISLTLRIHGPNFGVDGMPGGTAQLLATAMAVLSTGQVPGVWTVMTGWHPEPVPARQGAVVAGSGPDKPVCGAVALALTPLQPGGHGLRLCYRPPSAYHSRDNGKPGNHKAARPRFSLEALLDAFSDEDREVQGSGWQLSGRRQPGIPPCGRGVARWIKPRAQNGTKRRNGHGERRDLDYRRWGGDPAGLCVPGDRRWLSVGPILRPGRRHV